MARWRAIGWAMPGGRHLGLATDFPIGPSSKSLDSHIISLPALLPKPHYSCAFTSYIIFLHQCRIVKSAYEMSLDSLSLLTEP